LALSLLILLSWQGSKALAGLNPSEQRDFLIGFLGIVILNVFLCPLSFVLKGDNTLLGTRAIVSLALPWVINLALLIFFTFYRRWIALGALAPVAFFGAWAGCSGVFL
jgi:hypothetical protein